jgi:hypothetical protein
METKELLLKFMETSIDKINRCLANIYAIEQILIEKNIVSLEELKSLIKESERLPDRKIGIKVLEEMLNEIKEK